MNTKKLAVAFLALTMIAGCSSTAKDDAEADVDKVEDTVKEDAKDVEDDVKDDVEKAEDETVKTGSVEDSEGNTIIAELTYKDGKLEKVSLDKIDADGNSTKEAADAYGMKDASPIGKEWYEQIEYLEDYILKNGVDSVKLDDSGYAEEEDVLSGCTINLSAYMEAIDKAEEN
jgi:outer membrane murein-binding lipoprotein Lpp